LPTVGSFRFFYSPSFLRISNHIIVWFQRDNQCRLSAGVGDICHRNDGTKSQIGACVAVLARTAVCERPTLETNDGTFRLRYDLGMFQRWLCLLAVVSLLLGIGCRKQSKPQTVVVHLFRDLNSPYAYELDHRILEFQLTNPRLASGAPIVVKTFDDMDYKTAIQSRFDKDLRVEVVILNTAADVAGNPAMAANLSHAIDICSAVKACPANVPAFVPSSATGDNAEAGQKFIQALAAHK
jgi:hypothetical protein